MTRVTATDVAKAAGVSRSTVSFVLNETAGQTISPAVRQRVLTEAGRLGYQPDPHARALASGQSRIVLILLPEWPIEFIFSEMLNQASLVLDDAGYTLVTTDPSRPGHAQRLWQTMRPDIVIPVDSTPIELTQTLHRAGLRVQAPSPSAAMTVAPAMQVDHLHARGHREIAFAGSSIREFHAMSTERRAQVRARARHHALAVHTGTVSPENVHRRLDRWIGDGVTAVVAFNDTTAALVVGAALRRGLRVPEDLAVIGHDDSPIASLLVPSLSTIRFDLAALGRRLALRALAGLRDEEPEPFKESDVKVKLVEREST